MPYHVAVSLILSSLPLSSPHCIVGRKQIKVAKFIIQVSPFRSILFFSSVSISTACNPPNSVLTRVGGLCNVGCHITHPRRGSGSILARRNPALGWAAIVREGDGGHGPAWSCCLFDFYSSTWLWLYRPSCALTPASAPVTYAHLTTLSSSNCISMIPSALTALTIMPLKSIGNRRLSSSVHSVSSLMP